MKVLSIESSCDETSVSVVEKIGSEIKVLSSVTATSLNIHAITGGIIPENAARMQVKYILPVLIEALLKSAKSNSRDSKTNWEEAKDIIENEIDAIAVTYGPGLIGSLLVGVETAKTLSFVFHKPLVPVNHLLAHIYANFISSSKSSIIIHKSKIEFPFIGLIVSGGHTDLLFFKEHGNYEWLGGTRDDAAGEAFDKIGRVLRLSYPAGPEIERLSQKVKRTSIKFHSPLIHESNFDFSFSGLKTEAIRYFEKQSKDIRTAQNLKSINSSLINEISFATQKAIIDVLIKKTLAASEKYGCKNILVGGGVSANQMFRTELEHQAKNSKVKANVFFPEKIYSTDNGAMIGAYALLNYKTKNWKTTNANPELYFA